MPCSHCIAISTGCCRQWVFSGSVCCLSPYTKMLSAISPGVHHLVFGKGSFPIRREIGDKTCQLTLSTGICFMFREGLNGAIPFHTRSWESKGSHWAMVPGTQDTETNRNESPPQRGWVHWRMMGAHIQGLYISPLLWALGAPRGPGLRCRNRCLGVSPGLNDSELRPTGNRELSLRRCAPARVSSPKQRELWARRMGAGDEDPVRGICGGIGCHQSTGRGQSNREPVGEAAQGRKGSRV